MPVVPIIKYFFSLTIEGDVCYETNVWSFYFTCSAILATQKPAVPPRFSAQVGRAAAGFVVQGIALENTL